MLAITNCNERLVLGRAGEQEERAKTKGSEGKAMGFRWSKKVGMGRIQRMGMIGKAPGFGWLQCLKLYFVCSIGK